MTAKPDNPPAISLEAAEAILEGEDLSDEQYFMRLADMTGMEYGDLIAMLAERTKTDDR